MCCSPSGASSTYFNYRYYSNRARRRWVAVNSQYLPSFCKHNTQCITIVVTFIYWWRLRFPAKDLLRCISHPPKHEKTHICTHRVFVPLKFEVVNGKGNWYWFIFEWIHWGFDKGFSVKWWRLVSKRPKHSASFRFSGDYSQVLHWPNVIGSLPCGVGFKVTVCFFICLPQICMQCITIAQVHG